MTPRPSLLTRTWIVIPAIVLTLADAALTLGAQPNEYWAGNYLSAQEYSPWAAALLYRHPGAFAAFMVAWAVLALLVGLLLNEPWNRVWVLAIVMGHTTGTFARLQELGYSPALLTFLAAALLTIFCWRTSEAGRHPAMKPSPLSPSTDPDLHD